MGRAGRRRRAVTPLGTPRTKIRGSNTSTARGHVALAQFPHFTDLFKRLVALGEKCEESAQQVNPCLTKTTAAATRMGGCEEENGRGRNREREWGRKKGRKEGSFDLRQWPIRSICRRRRRRKGDENRGGECHPS